MIDCVMTLHITTEGNGENVQFFGRIDEEKREVELHYELKTIASMLLRAENFWGKRLILSVKGTDSRIYNMYNCVFHQQETSLSSTGMGMFKGRFERLIKQDYPLEKYNTLIFSFEGIEKVFHFSAFQINRDPEDKSVSIFLPPLDKKEIAINHELSGTVYTSFHGVPMDSCVEIHITQKKKIKITSSGEQTAEEMLGILYKTKQYLEFLLSQEIRLSSIVFRAKDSIRSAEVISDDILCPHTIIRQVSDNAYHESEENFFSGLCGWIEKYDSFRRVISIWEKTIYNTNVSNEDVFIWRCQAFELLCMLIPKVKDEAYKQLAPDQANPNLKNYLSVINSTYKMSSLGEKDFSVVKDARDKLTHNNPRKEVTDTQMKNAFVIIH